VVAIPVSLSHLLQLLPDGHDLLLARHFLGDDFSEKWGVQIVEKCSNRLIFYTFWLVIGKLMRIRIRFRMQIQMDLHPDLGISFH
jgi:hypothetical protein